MKRTSKPHITALIAMSFALASAPALAQDDASEKKLWIEKKSKPKDQVVKTSSIVKLSDQASPSVVNIIVTVRIGQERISKDIPGPRGEATAVGSGFIIHPDGFILTNNHVVENATEIKIRLNDNREFPASVIGTDPKTDVALVRVDHAPDVKFKAIALGDSDQVEVGAKVVAIGNPLGLNHTVTSGIVSALGRKDLAPGGRELQSDFIQTDASINPGNSGGPLINMSGEVIGINTAVNRQGQGIGFAIPINMVKALLPQLQDIGYVERTWLGVRVQAMTPVLARSFGMKKAIGALVSEVVKDSPAARGGVQAGDVILSFNGVSIKDSDQLGWLVSTGGTRAPVPVKLVRDGKEQSFDLSLEAIPNQKRPNIPSRKKDPPKVDHGLENLGLAVKNLDEQLARHLGARDTNGVVITQLDQASPARASGVRERDVITEVSGTPTTTSEEFYAALAQVRRGEIVRFRLIRGGKALYLAFEH